MAEAMPPLVRQFLREEYSDIDPQLPAILAELRCALAARRRRPRWATLAARRQGSLAAPVPGRPPPTYARRAQRPSDHSHRPAPFTPYA